MRISSDSMKRFLLYVILLVTVTFSVQAMDVEPEYVPEIKIKYTYTVENGDTIFFGYIPNVTIFPPLVFKDQKEKLEYYKLIRDIKKTLPYAKAVSVSVIETYEYMQTLPDEKVRQKHLEDVEKFMMDTYKPKLKKMSRNQGKILIKLIDRECNTPSYNIVKSLVGSFKAGVFNVFAGLFGNSLKTEYDPNGKDKLMERIVIQIEEGVL
jgi:hypothetical protein